MTVDSLNLDDITELYKHCNATVLIKFIELLQDPVIGILKDEEIAQDFLSKSGFLGFFCLFCGVLGAFCILANCLVFCYFYPRRRQIIPLIYLSLTACDLVSGVAAIATSITLGHLFFASSYDTSLTRILIMTSYNLASFTCRFSTWNSLILVLVRTVNIVRPHYRLKRVPAIVLILLFLVLTVTVFALDDLVERDAPANIWHRVRFNLVFSMTTRRLCIYLARKMCRVITLATMWIVCIIVPFVVPAALAVTALIVQVYYMVCKPAKRSRTNKRITVTILYLTAIYVLVNSLYFVATLLYLYVVKDMYPGISFLLFITSTVLPFLSSLANPIIITVRGKKIRSYVAGWLKRGVRVGNAGAPGSPSVGTRPISTISTYN